MEKEITVRATCSSCGRQYWATEDYVAAVQSGRLESLCGQCDESNKEANNDSDDVV